MKKGIRYLFAFCVIWRVASGAALAAGALGYLDVEIRALGKSSGTIADLTIENTTTEEVNIYFGPYVAIFDEDYSPIFIEGFPLRIPGGGKKILSAYGFSLLNHKPVLPHGKVFRDDVVFMGFDRTSYAHIADSVTTLQTQTSNTNDAVHIGYPGTGYPCNLVLVPATDGQAFSNLMIDAQMWIQKAYLIEHNAGNVSTALSKDPATQRDFLMQLATWIYAGALTGQPYTSAHLTEDLMVKFRKNTNGLSKDREAFLLQEVQKESKRFYASAFDIGIKAGIFLNGDSDRWAAGMENNSAGWYGIPDRLYPVFLEDMVLCEDLHGTRIEDRGSSDLFAENGRFSFSDLQHQVLGDGSVMISGRIDPFKFDGSLLWKTRNSPERIYEVNIDSNDNFEFIVPFGKHNTVNVDMVARDRENEYTVFSSRFGMDEQIVPVKKGDRISVQGLEAVVALISDDAVYLKEQKYTHRLIPGVSIPVNDQILALGKINARAGTADIRIITKKCCLPDSYGDVSSEPDTYDELFGRSADVSSKGYKGMILDPLIGFSPPEYVIGVVASLRSSMQVCCGWYKAGSFDQIWGPYMSVKLLEAMKSVVDSVAPETGRYRIVLMDPATRHHLDGILHGNRGQDVIEKLPSAKLFNPDLIIDGRLTFGCCAPTDNGPCVQSATKVALDVSLINADNGLVLSSYNSEEITYGQEAPPSCYQPLDDLAPTLREKIAREMSDRAAKKFTERLTWKVQW